jgi:hypothetical protein
MKVMDLKTSAVQAAKWPNVIMLWDKEVKQMPVVQPDVVNWFVDGVLQAQYVGPSVIAAIQAGAAAQHWTKNNYPFSAIEKSILVPYIATTPVLKTIKDVAQYLQSNDSDMAKIHPPTLRSIISGLRKYGASLTTTQEVDDFLSGKTLDLSISKDMLLGK